VATENVSAQFRFPLAELLFEGAGAGFEFGAGLGFGVGAGYRDFGERLGRDPGAGFGVGAGGFGVGAGLGLNTRALFCFDEG